MGGFMAKIYKEDVYCLGLLYSYRYANNSVVLKSDLDKFYEEIENNLKEMNIKGTFFYDWFEDDLNMYYPTILDNGEIYYVIYPNCNMDLIIPKIFNYLSVKVCIASQRENALNCLGLTKIDNKIVKKDEFEKKVKAR